MGNIIRKNLTVKNIPGTILIIAGLCLCSAGSGRINAVQNMGGPMGVSLYPFGEILYLGTGILFLTGGTILSAVPPGPVYLLLSLISFLPVLRNLWFYPVEDGAYYILRYGQNRAGGFSPPGPWQHFTGSACVTLFLFLGLSKTFNRFFSFNPPATGGKILYRGVLLLIAGGLFILLGNLYDSFVSSLISGNITDSQRFIYSARSYLLPVGLIITVPLIRRYDRIALLLLLGALVMLILLGVTSLAFRLPF